MKNKNKHNKNFIEKDKYLQLLKLFENGIRKLKMIICIYIHIGQSI